MAGELLYQLKKESKSRAIDRESAEYDFLNLLLKKAGFHADGCGLEEKLLKATYEVDESLGPK